MSFDAGNFRNVADGVEITPISSLSDQERIARARERGIAISKRSNASEFGFGYSEGHWQDFAGPQTSQYDANALVHKLGLLREPKFMQAKGRWISNESYDPRLGAWTRKNHAGMTQILATIDEVRQLVDARIAELGLSKVRLVEFCAQTMEENHGSIAGEQIWQRMSFEERMQRFKIQ